MNRLNIPGFEVVTINMGDKLNPDFKSALIADFPPGFTKDIFTDSEGGPLPVVSDREDDGGKQYISWGADNHLPAEIVTRAYRSPYVAPSLNHIILSMYSSGIKPYYIYYNNVNGNVVRRQIDYEAGGTYLRSRIGQLRSQRHSSPFITGKKGDSNMLDEELVQLESDLKQWDMTIKQWKTFTETNDLSHWLHEVATDLVYFWNWYPTVGLPPGRPGTRWNPTVTHLGHLQATCTRKGVMDEYGQINYCVFSREFGNETPVAVAPGDTENIIRQLVVPALDPRNAVSQLRELAGRQKNSDLKNRTLHYVLPMRIPTPGKPYYAKPTWYSIFISGIYYYLIALLVKRANRLDNGTMFSYIIHLNEEYIRWEYMKNNVVEGTEDATKVYNQLVKNLRDFISNPQNDGKALVAVNKTIDGKSVKWIEIEEINRMHEDTSVKDDIAEIANVILYAMGIHPQTVGAIPGKEKVASGTEARELNTLQQLDLFAFKMHLLRPLYIIKSFNGWDDHLYFDIPTHVLTTLDKNKKGVEQMSNNQE
ncbi:MAG: hypothetical protein LBK58_16105 [Prevotellaceae bacterium]|jgi:hypothetical protein|nr:hypothetical protein [Prevotellaceae bacterium]